MTRKISLNQLLGPLCGRDWHGRSVVFLLGAGCSVTSGVPDAGQLARKWLHELKRDGHDGLRDITDSSAAQDYFRICNARWGEGMAALKTEISRFTQSRHPASGYITFANILASPLPWPRPILKTVITTNFDNLIEQAFLKYTNHFPVVIPDPTLVEFMEKSEDGNFPVTILKIHGDSRYHSRNSRESTDEISEDVLNALQSRMKNSILIALGYAGNEKGIAELLGNLVRTRSIEEIFWVNKSAPGQPILKIFDDLPGRLTMVDHTDFDDFMLQWQERLHSLSYPSSSLAEMVSFRHHDQLMWKLGLYGRTAQQPISLNPSRFHDYFSTFAKISRDIYENNAPVTMAEKDLQNTLRKYRANVNLMVLAGSVYKSIIKDRTVYCDLVSCALDFSPDHAGANAEKGIICRESGNMSGAIRYFNAAIKNDPGDLNSRVNLCGCLLASDDGSAAYDEYQYCYHNVYETRHRLELAFYAYAREDFDKYEALTEILNNLVRNASPDFDFSINIAGAPAERQPLLRQVAEVMNGKRNEDGVRELIRREIH